MVDIDIEVPTEAERMTQLILNQFPGGLIRRRGASFKLAPLYRRTDPDIVYKGQGQKRQIQDNRDADYEAWRDYWARLHADKGRPDSSEAVRLFRGLVDFLCDGQDEMIDTLLHWIGFEADA